MMLTIGGMKFWKIILKNVLIPSNVILHDDIFNCFSVIKVDDVKHFPNIFKPIFLIEFSFKSSFIKLHFWIILKFAIPFSSISLFPNIKIESEKLLFKPSNIYFKPSFFIELPLKFNSFKNLFSFNKFVKYLHPSEQILFLLIPSSEERFKLIIEILWVKVLNNISAPLILISFDDKSK